MQAEISVDYRVLSLALFLAAIHACTNDSSVDNGDAGASDTGGLVGKDEYPSWLLWAKSLGGRVNDMAALPDGSFLLAGCYTEDDFFDEAVRSQNTTYSSTASMFVAKYGSEGDLSWVNTGTESENETCIYNMQVLADGSFAVDGSYSGRAVFGKGEANETELLASNGYNRFIGAYDSNGALRWVKSLVKGDWISRPQDIALLPDSAVVAIGNFEGAAAFGEGEPNQTELTAEIDNTDIRQSGADVYLVKYGPEGAFEWAKQAGGLHNDEGKGISALADGSFLVTGIFAGTATFGKREAGEIVLEAPGTKTNGVLNGPITSNEPSTEYNTDIFVAKYRSDGTVVWAKSAGSNTIFHRTLRFYDSGQDITALPDGSSLVTGSFGNVAVFGKGELNETELIAGENGGEENRWLVDAFVAKYGPQGLLQWARDAGGSLEGEQLPPSDVGYGVGVATDGSCYATGSIDGEATFGGGEAYTAETPGVFVAKYSSTGVLANAVTFGRDPYYDIGEAVAPLADGSVLVMGQYAGPFLAEGKKVFETLKSEESHDYIRKKFIFKLKL
jgi:hypothetical protein